MQRVPLANFTFTGGFQTPTNELNAPEGSLAEGSRNQLFTGSGTVVWKGLDSQGSSTGSRLMRQVLGSWGGLQDYTSGMIEILGRGSIFGDIGKSIWFIGGGRPNLQGIELASGVTAATDLQVSIAVNGVYSAGTTYVAGLPQPSAPDVGIIDVPGVGLVGEITGAVSFKIARERLTTGARSNASLTSQVINPSQKTVRITFPLASSGQDNWRLFATQSGFGGVGLHYAVPFDGSLDIPESLVASSTVDGIERSIEVDFKDGDLIPEVAYIDDYPPPAGTHAVRLANVMCVLGAYGDSTAPVSASDPGTVGAISNPNFYESYTPRYLVYFPESIVDAMARPTDEYAYIGHRDCVTALQYVGITTGPAVAVSMVWPDVGIKFPYNWCQVHGLLYVMSATAGPVRMLSNGSVDYNFANRVRSYMEKNGWTQDNTAVGSHPDTLSVVYFNRDTGEALSFSLQGEEWSTPTYFSDANVSGGALSCVNSVGRLIVTVQDGEDQTAYAWHEGATEMPISTFTNWIRGQRPVTVQEMDVAFDCDSKVAPVIMSLHRNLRQTYVRDAVTTDNSNVISSEALDLVQEDVGNMVCVFGPDVGGAGIDYLIGRIATETSPSSSLSASASPSHSASASPTASASVSASTSHSASSSGSASASRSASASASHSASASVSHSPSSSASASASPSTSSSPSSSPSSSASPS